MFAKFLWLSLLAGLSVSSIVQGKRISQIKCEEYIKDTETTASVVSPLLDPIITTYTSYNCSATVDLIVGGEEARKGEFRHQALLGWTTDEPDQYLFDCGGTVISDRYVLTAAHCSAKANDHGRGSPVIVRFAEIDLRTVGDEFDIAIERIIKHPEHRYRFAYHDIALVLLKERLRFSELVRPACLWDSEDLNVTSVIATGFGRMEHAAKRGSDTLRKVQLDVMDIQQCNDQFATTRSFPQGMIDGQLCIGSPLGDTCQGDSGGPVQVLVNGEGCTYHVVGVTSKGSYCGSTAPAVYTNVASYLDWIEQTVWGSK